MFHNMTPLSQTSLLTVATYFPWTVPHFGKLTKLRLRDVKRLKTRDLSCCFGALDLRHHAPALSAPVLIHRRVPRLRSPSAPALPKANHEYAGLSPTSRRSESGTYMMFMFYVYWIWFGHYKYMNTDALDRSCFAFFFFFVFNTSDEAAGLKRLNKQQYARKSVPIVNIEPILIKQKTAKQTKQVHIYTSEHEHWCVALSSLMKALVSFVSFTCVGSLFYGWNAFIEKAGRLFKWC